MQRFILIGALMLVGSLITAVLLYVAVQTLLYGEKTPEITDPVTDKQLEI